MFKDQTAKTITIECKCGYRIDVQKSSIHHRAPCPHRFSCDKCSLRYSIRMSLGNYILFRRLPSNIGFSKIDKMEA